MSIETTLELISGSEPLKPLGVDQVKKKRKFGTTTIDATRNKKSITKSAP